MSAAALSFPPGLMPRFSQFINGIKQRMGEVMLYRYDVAPLILPLGHYLTGVQRRLTAARAAGPAPLRLVDGQWEPTPCLPPFPD